MENEKHYFTVGLYIIGLSLLAAGFAMWIAATGHSDDIAYRIYFRESVSGLVEGGPVKYRGVTVGKVDSITIDKHDPQRIQVDTRLLKDTPIKTDTTASLKLAGITGAIYIELSAGTPEAPSLVSSIRDDEVPVIRSQESAVTAVMNQQPIIMEKLSHFADQMDKLASDETIANLNNLFTNTSAISGDVRDIVKDSKQDSRQVMVNLRKSARDINEVTETVKDNPSSLLFPSEEEGISPP
jgi:phospholipid/cholesterol/gamma-HCH transport system substrate-binding protein